MVSVRKINVMSRETLLYLARQGWRSWQMALHFSTSLSTIQRRLREFEISLKEIRYSSISKSQLKKRVKRILSQGHECGEITVDSHLKVMGHEVQRSKIRQVMKEIVPPKQRKLRRIFRRDYYCRAPLSVIHMDGYHKLVRWRFVIHGAIDGFSRRIFFLHLANNNRASTVLKQFRRGVYRLGMPSRIRIDKGKENIGAVKYMLMKRGCNRASVIAGRSVHNTRIERLWVDVRKRCTGIYRALFKEMERAGILNHLSELDLYCLHLIFKPLIKKSVEMFRKSWDLHKHRGLKHKSPKWVWDKPPTRDTGYSTTLKFSTDTQVNSTRSIQGFCTRLGSG